jgi:hypothetical protein
LKKVDIESSSWLGGLGAYGCAFCVQRLIALEIYKNGEPRNNKGCTYCGWGTLGKSIMGPIRNI